MTEGWLEYLYEVLNIKGGDADKSYVVALM